MQAPIAILSTHGRTEMPHSVRYLTGHVQVGQDHSYVLATDDTSMHV